jgi:hypothetical protein
VGFYATADTTITLDAKTFGTMISNMTVKIEDAVGFLAHVSFQYLTEGESCVIVSLSATTKSRMVRKSYVAKDMVNDNVRYRKRRVRFG